MRQSKLKADNFMECGDALRLGTNLTVWVTSKGFLEEVSTLLNEWIGRVQLEAKISNRSPPDSPLVEP